jgi:hypothetical protein
MQVIETGVETLSSSQQQAGLARLMEINNPIQATTNLYASVSTLIKSLEARHTQDFTLLGYKIGNEELSDLYKALSYVNKALVSLPHKEIQQRIAVMCNVITLANNFDPDMLALRGKALADELVKYPADIVVHAFEEIKKTCKFYPSFAEFYQHIEFRYRPRRLLRDELHKCIAIKERDARMLE